MIGPLLLFVSWALLRVEGKGLGAIGINAPAARLRQFAGGFLVAGMAVVLQQLGRSWATGIPWDANPAFTLDLALEHLRFTTNSVLFEELLFRGYLLYQAIRWLGMKRAVVLNAVVFGVYHWFSYGLFGNPVMMGFILLYTGAFGLMLAIAFATTKSVAAPIGLHLGWNLVTYLVFSSGPLGHALLLPSTGTTPLEAGGMAGLLTDFGVPLLLIVGVSLYLMRSTPQNGSPAAPAPPPP